MSGYLLIRQWLTTHSFSQYADGFVKLSELGNPVHPGSVPELLVAYTSSSLETIWVQLRRLLPSE